MGNNRRSIPNDDVAKGRESIEMKNDPKEKTNHYIEILTCALDNLNDAAFLINEDLSYDYVNRRACDSLGYTREELLSLTVPDIDAVLSAEAIHSGFHSQSPGEPTTFESRHRRKDGTLFPVEVFGNCFEFDGRGYHLTLCKDITERKRMEREGRETLRFFQNMDRVNQIILQSVSPEEMLNGVLDLMLTIFDCDRAYLLHPCDPDAETFQVAFECVRPEYPGGKALGGAIPVDIDVAETMRILLNAEGVVQFGPNAVRSVPPSVVQLVSVRSFMGMALHPGIGDAWQLGIHQCSHARLWSREDERLLKGIGQRITDGLTSMLTLQALQKNEESLRLILEAVQAVMWQEDSVTGAHREFGPVDKLFGRKVGFLHHTLDDFSASIFEEDRDRVMKTIGDAKIRKHDYETEYRIPSGDGGVRWIGAKGKFQPAAEGKPGGRMVGIAMDITDRKRAEEKLREREREFRSIADNIPDNVARWDKEGRYLYVNAMHENMTIRTPADRVMGKTIREAFPDGRFSAVEQAIHQIIQTGEEHRLVKQPVPMDDGTVQMHDVILVPEFNEKGELIGVLGLGRDMTEIYRMQDEISKKERELRLLTETSPGMMGSFYMRPDGSGCMPYVSPNISELFGLRPEDVRDDNASLMALNHPDDAARVQESIAESARTMSIWHEEYRINHPTKGERWMESNTKPLAYPDGGVIWYGYVHDITDRKRVEELLRDSEEKYRVMVENNMTSVYIIQDGYFRFVNRKWCEIQGYEYEEVVDKLPVSEFVHPDDRERFLDLVQKRVEEKLGPLSFELKTLRKDGSTLVWKILGGHFLYRGRPAISGTALDITREKELESMLLQAQKLEAIGTLAGGIAHDFNNILSGLMGHTELAMLSCDDDQRNHHHQQVLKSCERARDLIDQILTMSRNHEEKLEPVDTVLIAKEVVKFMRSSLPTTINIQHAVPSFPMVVSANPVWIHQILMNLCTNAAHAMGGISGELRICIDEVPLPDPEVQSLNLPPGPYVRLQVSDTGCGITPDIRDRVFDPFFTTKQVGEGTGLGLSVIYGLVKTMGGGIALESEPGKGTTFAVCLPHIGSHTVSSETEKRPGAFPIGSERILLVDDEDVVLEMYQHMLERLGYEVVTAGNGMAALKLFRDAPERFDAVFTDFAMPKMTGLEMAQKMETMRPGLPIFLNSGYGDIIDEKTADRIGIGKIFKKPVAMEELARGLRAVLDAPIYGEKLEVDRDSY